MKQNGFSYDCSIEEGYQDDQDGTNFYWPYTLDNGGTDGWAKLILMSGKDYDPENTIPDKEPLSPQPGFWQVPNHCVIIPPDNECSNYGLSYSLRDAIKTKMKWFDTENGKFTGFDWNFWAQAKMSKDESVAVLKYNLDLRLRNNRAPFMWGAHTGNFTKHKDSSYPGILNRERQEVVEEFVDYALTIPEVRIVPAKDIVAWCENPVALGTATTISNVKVKSQHMNITNINSIGGKINIAKSGKYSISLLTPRGQVIKNANNLTLVSGTNVFAFDKKQQVAKGLYFIKVIGDNFKKIQNIVIR